MLYFPVLSGTSDGPKSEETKRKRSQRSPSKCVIRAERKKTTTKTHNPQQYRAAAKRRTIEKQKLRQKKKPIQPYEQMCTLQSWHGIAH